MKKTLALLMALVMVASVMTFATAEEPQFKGHLKYLTTYWPTDPNEEPPAKKLEELTGYQVTYYMLPSEGGDEKLNLELSSGAEYDIIRMSVNQFRTLAPKGAFIDLKPYLDSTTNLKSIMNDLEWSAASIDDKIYGIPQFDAHYIGSGICYNVQQWEKAGYKLEGDNRQLTLAQFTDILRKVKETSPDVIPFVGREALCQPISSAFGIVSHDWQPDVDGKIVPRFGHSNMKNYITCMHDLYTEGLIDVEWPVNKGENVQQKFTSGNASAMLLHWASSTSIEASLADTTGGNTTDYLFPTSDDNGLTRMGANAGVNAFGVIPTTCKQIETVIDYLDIRSDFKVFEESFLGVEGEQWEFRDTDGNGEMEYWPLLGEEHQPGFTAWFNGHYFNLVNSPESFTTLWLCRARKGAVQYAATVKINQYPKENWVDSPLAYAPPMEAVAKYAQALNMMEQDYILECIAGTRSVDEYDSVYAEWLAEGGQEMIDEVNAYVAKMGL